MGRRRAFLPDRVVPTILDSTTLSRLLGHTVGFSLVLAASAALGQTAPPGQQPSGQTAPPAQEGPTPGGTSGTIAQENVQLAPVDVKGRRQGDLLVPESSFGRFPENLVKDIPQSLTIVPLELMRQQADFSLRDALRNVSGISIAAGEGGLQGDNLTLRGFPAKNDLFLDGIRDFGSYTRDVFNLEAVEVLKGPSSVMFGRGSTGGVINQISKVPTLVPYYNVASTIGTGLFIRDTADLNQPVGHGIALRLNTMVEKDDVVGRDEVSVKRYGFAPQVAFGLGGPTTLTFSFLYQHENNMPDDGVPYLFGRPAPVNPSNFYGLPNVDFENTDVYISTAKFEHAFSDSVKLRSVVRYAWYGRDTQPTAPRIAGTVTPTTDLATVLVNRGQPARDSEESIVTSQTDVTAHFSTWGFKHKLVAGVEYDHEIFDITRFTFVGQPQANLLNPYPFPPTPLLRKTNMVRTDTTGNAVGFWAVDELELLSWLKIMGGARWDYFHADQTVRQTNVNLSNTDTVWSPRAAIIVQPTNWQTYYFSYGTSFNPSAENLTLAANTVNVDPEKTRVFELGAKLDLFNNRFGVRGSLFQIVKTDARTSDPDTAIVTLDGKQRSQGYEIEIVGQPVNGWNIWAGYTYLDTRVLDSEDVMAGVPIQGKRLTNAPMNTANLWSTYDIPPEWLWNQRFQVGGGFNYVGFRFANQNNTNSVPGYIRGDLTAAWRPIPKFELRMNVQNVADNRFYESVYQGHVVPGAGRTVLFTGTFTY
jgi:catecholate siderophore receptor